MKEILRTRRLLLREMTEGDIPDLEEMLLDPEVMYAYPHTFTKEDVENRLARQQQRYRQDGFGLWAVVLRSTGEMVGQAGLTWQDCEGQPVLEVGYLLKKRFWHQGYASEAARACRDYAFRVLGAEKVSSIIKTDNLASIRVAQRNGMAREKAFTAHYYNVPVPHYLYTVWKDDTMDTTYCIEQLKAAVRHRQPSGFTDRAADYLLEELSRLGYAPEKTRKGGVRVCLGGQGNPLLLMAHVDTLGAVVQTIKGNGRLVLSPVGGLRAENCEAENCRIYTRFDGTYTGCLQIANASVHVNDDYAGSQRKFGQMEVVIDEPVKSEKDTRALGICEGDFVCFDPRTTVTQSGYIKSRFLDDKLSAAILLAYAKELKDTGTIPQRKVYLHFTVYEEVGHGAAASVPEDVVELLSVDMGCVGEGLQCTEREGLHLRQGFRRALRLRRHHGLGGGRQGSRGRLRRGCVSPLRQRRRSRPERRLRRAPRPHRRGGVRLPRVRALPRGGRGEHLKAVVAVHHQIKNSQTRGLAPSFIREGKRQCSGQG